MPEAFREYPIREVGIYTVSYADNASGTERIKEGDILTIRKPQGAIGQKEGALILWLLIEGLDSSEMDRLNDRMGDNPDDLNAPIFDKRRYCIPLERLFILCPSLNLPRVRDTMDVYQPFLSIETDQYFYRYTLEGHDIHGIRTLPDSAVKASPFQVHGLVYDKALRQYL